MIGAILVYLHTMTFTALTIIFFFAILASFTQRVTGFGSGILIMTVLPHLFPSLGEATALSGLLSAFTSCLPAISMRRSVPWRKLLPVLFTFLLVSYFAVEVLSGVNAIVFKRVLGGVLIALSIYFFIFNSKIQVKPSTGLQIGLGTVSGVMGGLFAMQGPPAVVYFMAASDNREEYMAMTQWYFFAGNVMLSIFRFKEGFITQNVGLAFLVGLPAVFLGITLGARVYQHIKVDTLRRIIYAFLALAGLVALIS